MSVRLTTLENGITVISQNMIGAQSVALGLWVLTGSSHERTGQEGLAHLMEHMLFKGTASRSALDISMRFDALGAELDAFTTKDHTCFYTRMVTGNLEPCFEVMADMMLNPAFEPAQVELEREVVLEEIASSQDEPEDVAFDLFCRALYGSHPLSKPVLGTSERVTGYTAADLRAFYAQHYVASNLVVVACGQIDHGRLLELVSRYLGDMPQGIQGDAVEVPVPVPSKLAALRRDGEQAHIIMGVPWVTAADPSRFACQIVDSALGGTMSSRLFFEVREKRGLAYSVYTSSQLYVQAGQFEVCVATRPDNIAQVMQVIREQLAFAARQGLDAAELERVREMVCGSYVLSMESAHNRMLRLGKMASSRLRPVSHEATCSAYRACTLEEVNDSAARLLAQELSVAVVSPFDVQDIERMI